MNIAESMKWYVIYNCLYVGIKSWIFDYIWENKNTWITAKDIPLAPKYVQIWLNTAYSLWYFEIRDWKYFLKKEYENQLLNKESPAYQWELICLFVEHLSKDMTTQPKYMKNWEKYTFWEHNKEFIDLLYKRWIQRAKTFINNIWKDYEKLIFSKKSNICDIWCGSWGFIFTLNEKYNKPEYFGIDTDEKSIKIANSKNKFPNINFNKWNFIDTSFETPFDCIIMVLCLHEILPEQRQKVINECYKKLNKNWVLLIMEFPYPSSQQDFNNPQYLMWILDQYFEMTWGTEHINWEEQQELLQNAWFKNIKRKFFDDNVYMLISAEK